MYTNSVITCGNLSGQNLAGSCFNNSILTQVNFSGSSLYRCTFAGAVLEGCIFEGCDMRYVIGDGNVIRNLFIEQYHIVQVRDQLAINCTQRSVAQWEHLYTTNRFKGIPEAIAVLPYIEEIQNFIKGVKCQCS